MADSLLQQIQNEAVDSSHDLADLLRKCRVLAQRLGNEDLKEWVRCELNGYSTKDETQLPEYRKLFPVVVKGHYVGMFGAQINNFPIPMSAVEEEKMREPIFGINIGHGISEIQHLIAGSDTGDLTWHLPPEARYFIKDPCVRQDHQLADVWQVCSTAALEKILNTVRNKILDFTLELESEVERTGAPIQKLNKQEPEKVQQIFNNHIQGPVGNVAQGNRDVSQTATVNTGDLSSLKEALQELGLPKELEAEILTAAEESQPENGKLPARLAELVGKVVTLGMQGALAISGTVAVDMLTRALNQFFGL